jgi:hypothetical protein
MDLLYATIVALGDEKQTGRAVPLVELPQLIHNWLDFTARSDQFKIDTAASISKQDGCEAGSQQIDMKGASRSLIKC